MGLSELEYEKLLENQRVAAGKPPHIPWRRSGQDLSEAELERIGTQILEHDGWRSLKTNPVSRRGRGAGFGELGMADYLYIRYGKLRGAAQVLWVEWKRPDGEVAAHQALWHAREREKGALVAVATQDFDATPEGFDCWYSQSGLKRRS